MNERFSLYSPPIPQELKAKYEGALHGELRWLNGELVAKRQESDLQHVQGMFEIHGELETQYPHLVSEIDSDTAEHMMYIHDAGEILAHDLAHTVPNYDAIHDRWKRRERAAFRFLTGSHISDIELRAHARKLYQRYDAKDPMDKESHYVQMIDKIQALRFGTKYVFSGRQVRRRAAQQVRLNYAINLCMAPVLRLHPIVSSNAQAELANFFDGEISRFNQAKYNPEDVSFYRNQFQALLNKPQ